MGLPARAGLLYHRLQYAVKATRFNRAATDLEHAFYHAQRMLPFCPIAMVPG